jgi:hypothetical protein
LISLQAASMFLVSRSYRTWVGVYGAQLLLLLLEHTGRFKSIVMKLFLVEFSTNEETCKILGFHGGAFRFSSSLS